MRLRRKIDYADFLKRLHRLFKKRIFLLLCFYALMLLCTLGGCGYTAKTILPNDIKTIHVALFKNEIDITKEVSINDKYEVYRPDIEVDLRDTIIKRLFLDGHLKVSSKDSSDAILEGEITEYRKDPLRYQNENVTEYRISLVCDIRLRDAKTSEVLLELKALIGDTTYFTTGSLQKSETQALNSATSDLARRIVNRIVENW